MFEPTDQTFQRNFYLQFQASRAGSRAFYFDLRLFLSDFHVDLTTRLETAKNTLTPNNDLQELALDIRKLRKQLTDATGFLPSYDQRQCQAVRCIQLVSTIQDCLL